MATVSIQKTINNLPLRRGPRPAGRCQSIDCGMMIVDSKSYQCKQCIARRNWLMNQSGGSPNTRGLTRRRQYIEKPRRSSPYPHFKCFSALLLEFKNRLAGFLQAQSIFCLFKQMKDANALFAFDGEFSIVALDFDLIKRKDEVDSQAMKYRREIEHVGRIKFNPKRLVSILEGGGIAIRFVSVYSVPVLRATVCDNKTVINTVSKDMQCELEIASVPDDSHRFIPGQRTIIRFRLLG
ncbi:hypothetical protein BJ912DRAFT_269433 [Pholiota molesta]|nr:hypothetical protein BJ912DRAFT_269433 [Pholiota molesta]